MQEDDEKGLLQGGKGLSWAQILVVSQNIPNVLGVAWGHLEWWEDEGDAALVWCSVPHLAMDSRGSAEPSQLWEEPWGWNCVTGLRMSRHKSVTGCGTVFLMMCLK